MTTTPNMGLTLPTPSVTAGPLYAQEEVTAFTTIDAHTHSPGSGVQIGAAGLNIQGDVPFNSNNVNSVRGLRLISQGSLPTLPLDLRMIYSYNGELYYQDASGNNVQMTNAGSVAGATGTITGLSSPASASYSAGRFTFNQAASKPGRLSISDINLYEYNNASANAITIKSPASLAAPYTLTLLSAPPGSTSVLTSDSSGNMGTVATTGSGNVVLASSPTIIGGVISDVTINSGSVIVASTIDSSAIGSTTPSTGVFTSLVANTSLSTTAGLTVSGNSIVAGLTATSVTSTGAILGISGTAGAPGFSFSADASLGMARLSPSTVSLCAGGVESLRATGSSVAVTGALTCTSINTNSGGALKFKTFSGSIPSTSSITTSAVSGTIYAVHGVDTTADATIAGTDYSGGLAYLLFANISSGQVEIANPTSTTRNYNVVVTYI